MNSLPWFSLVSTSSHTALVTEDKGWHILRSTGYGGTHFNLYYTAI